MSVPTPLLDFIRRGEADRDVRILAARGVLAPRAHEQLAILVHLLDDPDADVRRTADGTLGRIPEAALSAFLARRDVTVGLREFFADRGVFPAVMPPIDSEEADDPLYDGEERPAGAPGGDESPAAADLEVPHGDAVRESIAQQVARMSFTERLTAALRGSREVRAVLIRDPNKAVSTAVLSSPKLSESEIEAFARMATVSEDVLRMIGSNRAWMRNYAVVCGLARNPKTPIPLSLNLLGRLNDRDLNMLSIDRNVPEPLRIAARRRVVDASRR